MFHTFSARSAEMEKSRLVQRFPADEDLFLVLIDRSAFTVQRRSACDNDCNCDQMAALHFVCMHAAAVSRTVHEFNVGVQGGAGCTDFDTG